MGGKKSSSPEVDNLGSYARALFNETAGLRKTYEDQGLEALKTGGITAQIPLIARALEASKGQLSQDLQATNDDLARQNLAGTPFGEGIRSQARITGGQQIARIPTDYAQGFIQQLPSFLASLTGQSFGGMGNAAGAQSNIVQSRNQGFTSSLNTFVPLATSLGVGALSGGMGAGMGGGSLGTIMTGALGGMKGKL